MAVTADKPTPYAPTRTILDLIERHRSRGLPAPVTAEVLARAGIPESLIPRTLQALPILDLIDESGNPTPTFESIRLAPEAEYKKRLEDWLKGAYADVFSFVDPTKDDETRIRDAFRGYQPVGQQARMVTLFQGLCAAAGLLPEKAAQTRAQASTRSNPRPVSPRVQRNIASLGGKRVTAPTQSGLPAPLAGLLSSLPPEGRGWTEERRKKFLETFGTVLDFCFPVVESEDQLEDEET